MISGLGRIIGGFLRLCQENCSIYATFKKYIQYIVVFDKRILAYDTGNPAPCQDGDVIQPAFDF
jgi:hypothetical protein